ncbi:MAG: hypothetical protein ACREMY_12465, partial [bacterium]
DVASVAVRAAIAVNELLMRDPDLLRAAVGIGPIASVAGRRLFRRGLFRPGAFLFSEYRTGLLRLRVPWSPDFRPGNRLRFRRSR